MVRVEVEREDAERLVDREFAEHRLTGGFTLHPRQRRSIPFTVGLPLQTPFNIVGGMELKGVRLGVRTDLEIARSLDKGDFDPIRVEPLPAQHRLLGAFERIGCRFLRSDVEQGHIPGAELPFYQELEFAAPPELRGRLSEIEVTFLAAPHQLDVLSRPTDGAGSSTPAVPGQTTQRRRGRSGPADRAGRVLPGSCGGVRPGLRRAGGHAGVAGDGRGAPDRRRRLGVGVNAGLVGADPVGGPQFHRRCGRTSRPAGIDYPALIAAGVTQPGRVVRVCPDLLVAEGLGTGCSAVWVSPRVDPVTVPGNPTVVQALRPLRGRLRRAWTTVGTPSMIRRADARRDPLDHRSDVVLGLKFMAPALAGRLPPGAGRCPDPASLRRGPRSGAGGAGCGGGAGKQRL